MLRETGGWLLAGWHEFTYWVFTLFSSRLLNPTDGHCLISQLHSSATTPSANNNDNNNNNNNTVGPTYSILGWLGWEAGAEVVDDVVLCGDNPDSGGGGGPLSPVRLDLSRPGRLEVSSPTQWDIRWRIISSSLLPPSSSPSLLLSYSSPALLSRPDLPKYGTNKRSKIFPVDMETSSGNFPRRCWRDSRCLYLGKKEAAFAVFP